MSWTPETDATLAALWNAGVMCSEIAGKICVTKNALIGRARRNASRLGLRMPHPGAAREARSSRNRSVEPHVKAAKTRKRPQSVRRAAPPPAAKAPVVELVPQPSLRIGFADLDKTHCCWPYGDPKTPDFHFCGHSRCDGSPYCAAHTLASYRPWVSRAVAHRHGFFKAKTRRGG